MALADDDGLSLVDLDGSRSVPSRLDGLPQPPCEGLLHPGLPVARPGYLAFVQCRTGYAAPLDLDGHARPLGPATLILPSLRPEAVWLVEQRGPYGMEVEVTEVDGVGTVLTPTRRLSGEAFPVGPVSGGLAVTRGSSLEVWDPAKGTVVWRAGIPGWPLATHGDIVAWVPQDDDANVHLTNVTTRATRLIPHPRGATRASRRRAEFSPHGSHLAAMWAVGEGDRERTSLGVVDVASGTVELVGEAWVPSPFAEPDPLTWSPDGRWLFYGRDFVAGFDLGSSGTHRVRLRLQAPSEVVAISGGQE